jgi:hypothetical protein
MQDDTLIPLRRLAREVPSGRSDGHAHEKTLARWGRIGIGGVRLEITKCGGTLCSSRAALKRFFDRLTTGHGLADEQLGAVPGPSPRQEQAERKADELLGPA